jgi:hypothetical protein
MERTRHAELGFDTEDPPLHPFSLGVSGQEFS